MKVIRFLLCVTFVLVLSKSAFAFQNEPDGFRGIKWGEKIDKLKGMTFVEKGVDTDLYERNTDGRHIGDAIVKKTRYVFKDGVFVMVHIEYEGESNFKKLIKYFSKEHGSPTVKDVFQYPEKGSLWQSSNNSLSIAVGYNPTTKKGVIVYVKK